MKARRFLNLMIVSLVAMAYTSCSSSDDVIDTPDPIVKTYTMTVDAQKGSNGTRALDLDGSTLNSTWTVGDEVEVWTADGTKKYGVLSAESGGASTKLRGTLTELPGNGESLLLKYLSPDYNSQKGTIESISSNCDYSTATVTATVAGSAVTTTTASFANQQAVIKFTLKNADGSASLGNPTAFSVTDGTNTVTLSDIPAETYITNGSGVLYVAFPASGVSATITLSATVSGVVYGLAKTDITFTNSKYYGVTVKMKEAPVFSVSDSKKIVFSPGNLQATTTDNGENWTWAFAAHQWDYVGNAAANNAITGNKTVSTNGTVDLFGWSTSSTYNGIHNSSDPEDYSGDFKDWGSHSDVIAGIGSGWRTLTSAEWKYLFNTRTASTVGGTDDGRYAKAKVNGVQGVILFPDTYTHPDGVTAPTGVNATGNTGWNGNNYSSADWTKMESAGCVFLPAAGGRPGSSVVSVGSYGYYWSSTADGTRNAYRVSFSSSLFYAGNGSSYRYAGYSVRLVR